MSRLSHCVPVLVAALGVALSTSSAAVNTPHHPAAKSAGHHQAPAHKHGHGHAHGGHGRPGGPVLHLGPGGKRKKGAGHHHRPVPKRTFVKGTRPAGKLRGAEKPRIAAFVAANPNLPAPQRQALNNVLSGQPLSGADRSSLSELLLSDNPGLTPAVREALSQALNEDADRHVQAFAQRQLRVANDTEEALKVWVLYRTRLGPKGWVWLPGPPGQPKQAAVFDVPPGKVTTLKNSNEYPISAARVRIWARSDSGKEWLDYQDEDLWLVPEREGREHRYYAAQVETFAFTFDNNSESLNQ